MTFLLTISMNELMKKYKSNIKVVSFEIMKSSKPHKINPSCSRFCGLFVLNIYVCKVIVVFLSVSCSSIYSNMPSDLNTLGSLPDFDTLSSFRTWTFCVLLRIWYSVFVFKIVYSWVCLQTFVLWVRHWNRVHIFRLRIC